MSIATATENGRRAPPVTVIAIVFSIIFVTFLFYLIFRQREQPLFKVSANLTYFLFGRDTAKVAHIDFSNGTYPALYTPHHESSEQMELPGFVLF